MSDEPLSQSLNKFSLTCPHVLMVDSHDYIGIENDLQEVSEDQPADDIHDQEPPVENEASEVDDASSGRAHQLSSDPTSRPCTQDDLTFSDFEDDVADDVLSLEGCLTLLRIEIQMVRLITFLLRRQK